MLFFGLLKKVDIYFVMYGVMKFEKKNEYCISFGEI